jgi:rubrerythrin
MDRFQFSGKDILEIAQRIELNGEAFYREARGIVQNKDLQELFLYLERQEKIHYNDFKRLAKLGEENKFTSYSQIAEAEEMTLYLNALADSKIFTDSKAGAELGRNVKSDEEAIKIAIGLEKDSILFYSEMLRMVKEADKKMVHYLIDEERDHVRRLRELKIDSPVS